MTARHFRTLPKRNYVSLTEYFTWILDGVPRTDADLKEQAEKQCLRDSQEWGSAFGPEWLLYPLQLMADGATDYPESIAGNEESLRLGRRHFRAAHQWQVKSGYPAAAAALAAVNAEIERRRKPDERQIAVEAHTFEHAQSEKPILFGRRWDSARNRASPEHEPIPATFLFQPCRFFSDFFRGYSEIVRWNDEGSPNGLLDSIFSTEHSTTAYIDVKIERKAAERLALELRRPLSLAKREKARRDCLSWLIGIMTKSPANPTHTRPELAAEANAKFGIGPTDFTTVWTRAIEASRAVAWKQAGRRKKSPR